MSELGPCPTCARHVAIDDGACPFCGADTAGARPGPVRVVSRRELTRAAVFAGAAVFLGACGGAEEPIDDAEGGGTAGGDDTDDGGGADFSHASDDGPHEGDARADGESDEGHASDGGGGSDEQRRRREEEARLEEERRRREQEELEREMEWRRRRGGRCTPDGICPPYGTPPVRDALV